MSEYLSQVMMEGGRCHVWHHTGVTVVCFQKEFVNIITLLQGVICGEWGEVCSLVYHDYGRYSVL